MKSTKSKHVSCNRYFWTQPLFFGRGQDRAITRDHFKGYTKKLGESFGFILCDGLFCCPIPQRLRQWRHLLARTRGWAHASPYSNLSDFLFSCGCGGHSFVVAAFEFWRAWLAGQSDSGAVLPLKIIICSGGLSTARRSRKAFDPAVLHHDKLRRIQRSREVVFGRKCKCDRVE
jgi:hypothetical protein